LVAQLRRQAFMSLHTLLQKTDYVEKFVAKGFGPLVSRFALRTGKSFDGMLGSVFNLETRGIKLQHVREKAEREKAAEQVQDLSRALSRSMSVAVHLCAH